MFEYDRYAKQIIEFQEYLEKLLDEHFDEKDTMLYPFDFELSFKGKSCKIGFGANEYYSILEMLQNIIEEL